MSCYHTEVIGNSRFSVIVTGSPAVVRLWSANAIGINLLQWRHNKRSGIAKHQPHDCLVNCLFRRRSKKTSSKVRVTGFCAGNSPVTGEFPAQKASNAKNVFIWWRSMRYVTTASKITAKNHYSNFIMSAMASQITGVSIVYSTVCSGADQRKHQRSATPAFVSGIHRWLVNLPHKGPVTRKIFPFDYVIMIKM